MPAISPQLGSHSNPFHTNKRAELVHPENSRFAPGSGHNIPRDNKLRDLEGLEDALLTAGSRFPDLERLLRYESQYPDTAMSWPKIYELLASDPVLLEAAIDASPGLGEYLERRRIQDAIREKEESVIQ